MDEDRYKIHTAEGVDLDLALAGLGSRGLAALLDYMVKAAIVVAVLYLAWLPASYDLDASGQTDYALPEGIWIAVGVVGAFLSVYGYEVLFEAYRRGQTPGKDVIGLRVVRVSGEPVDLRAAAIRNIIRIIDGPLTFYVVGAIAIAVSKKNQRLGDMAASTLVVRERFASDPATPPPPPPRRAFAPSPPNLPGREPPPLPPGYRQPAPPQPAQAVPVTARTEFPRWDVGGITDDEVAIAHRFLRRRDTLDGAARERLAADIGDRLRPRVVGVPADLAPELFLEELVARKQRPG